MKIYIAHSRGFDFEKELYRPIRADDELEQENIILPHEEVDASKNTREFYKRLDLVIAEASYPATGLGIELGWAYDDGVPIAVLHRSNANVSHSLYAVTQEFYKYHDCNEIPAIIKDIINAHQCN